MRIAVALVLLLASIPARAYETLHLRSKILGETRELLVHVPERSKNARYPVIYVLDGRSNHLVAAAASSFLANLGEMPEAIVVAVPNTNRMRDLTPNANFLDFLTKELVPYIDARYRTQPMRVLVGHSLGGLFTTWAMAARPDAFRIWIALEPGLRWHERAVIADMQKLFAGHRDLRVRYITVAEPSRSGWGADWDTVVAAAPPNVMMKRIDIPGVAHAAIPYRGIYESLEAAFADYVADESAMTVAALDAQYAALSREYGYNVAVPLSAWLYLADRTMEAKQFEEADRAIKRAEAMEPDNKEVRDYREALRAARRRPLSRRDGGAPLSITIRG